MKLVSKYSLDFDGVDDVVSLGSFDLLGNATDFSISAWIKADLSHSGTIVNGRGYTSIDKFWLGVDEDEVIGFIYDGSVYAQTRYTVDYWGEWHHVVLAVNDTAKTVKLYWDGSEVLSTSYTGSVQTGTMTNFKVGTGFSGTYKYFDGKIDDVMVFDRELSSAEVSTLYSKGFVSSGLILCWPFEEGSGTTVYDRSGLHNHGTVSGAVFADGYDVDVMKRAKAFLLRKLERRVEDKIMRSLRGLSFDGVDDLVTVADSATLNPTSEITVYASILVNSLPSVNADIISKRDSSNDGSFTLIFGTTSKIGWWIRDSNTWHGPANYAIELGKWYDVIATYDGSELKLYLNGELVRTYAYVGDIDDAIGIDVNIGYSPATGGYFNGIIDEIRVYNVAKTDNEVYAMSRDYIDTDGLVLWLKMEEGSGTTVKDYSGNGNNGTVSGATWSYGRHGWNI